MSTGHALQRLTWRTWLLWVAVCAVIPVLNAVLATAANKRVLRTDPNAGLITDLVWVTVLVTVLLPRLFEWFALRSLAPRLRLIEWYGAATVSGMVWIACVFTMESNPLLPSFGQLLTEPARALEIYGFKARADGSFTFVDFLSLPWHLPVISALFVAVTLYALPAFVLSRRSGHRFIVLFAAAIAGALAPIICEALYGILGGGFRWQGSSLNGMGWPARFNELWLRATFGAVGGALSGLTFSAMTRLRSDAADADARWLPRLESRRGFALIALATLMIALAPAGLKYSFGPNGLAAGFPAIRKAFTLAPSQDTSTGETILAFSHHSDVAAHQYPAASLTPDGHSLTVRTADLAIRHIDIATGRTLGQFGEPLAPFERFDQTWSPDARHFILRSWGAEYPVPNSFYKPRAARIRVFSPASHIATADWQSKPFECGESYANPSLIFAPDGQSIWVLCAPPQGTEVGGESAIQLSFPALERIGKSPKRSDSRGAILYDGRPASWQFGVTKDSTLRVTDLASGEDLLAIDGLDASDRGAKMTFQSHASRITDERAVLLYCGFPTDSISPTDREKIMAAINRCRELTFDTKTKAMLSSREASRLDFLHPAPMLVGGRKLTFVTLNSSASKTGALLVRDAASDKEIQRVTTIAQGIVGLTPGNRWLVTIEDSSRRLRLYRVGW